MPKINSGIKSIERNDSPPEREPILGEGWVGGLALRATALMLAPAVIAYEKIQERLHDRQKAD